MAPLALNDWILVGVALLGFVVLYAYPLCRAFSYGLAFARNPLNRVAPLSPWQLFDHAAGKKLRWWQVFWLGCAAGLFAFAPPLIVPTALSVVAAYAICYAAAPRCANFGALLSLVSLPAFLFMPIAVANGPQTFGEAVAALAASCVSYLLVVAVAKAGARRKGDRWFRFEQ